MMNTTMIPHATNPVLILDFDGTLSEITANPSGAMPYPGVVFLLEKIKQRHPLFLVTGRVLENLEDILPVTELFAYGLHGTQSGFLGGDKTWQSISSETLDALALLKKSAPVISGLRVEDKQYGFALHYRNCLELSESSITEILDVWLKEISPCLSLIKGKKVYDIRAAGYSKGTAVRDIVNQYPEYTPVYIGDDTTDEEAFEELQSASLVSSTMLHSITIKVGAETTKAQYRLESVAEVVSYLQGYV